MNFGERLKEARNAAGLTGQQLGEAIGCSKQNISHWEAGRFEPSLGFLTQLCEVLDVSADWLVLGKAPGELSPEALQQAYFYENLSAEARRKFEAMKSLVIDAPAAPTPSPPKSFEYRKRTTLAPFSPAGPKPKAVKK